jgi:hypothetical protein
MRRAPTLARNMRDDVTHQKQLYCSKARVDSCVHLMDDAGP